MLLESWKRHKQVSRFGCMENENERKSVTNHKSQSIFYSSFYHFQWREEIRLLFGEVTHKFIKKIENSLPALCALQPKNPRFLVDFQTTILFFLPVSRHPSDYLTLFSSRSFPNFTLTRRQCDMRYSIFIFRCCRCCAAAIRIRWGAKQCQKSVAKFHEFQYTFCVRWRRHSVSDDIQFLDARKKRSSVEFNIYYRHESR